MGTPSPAQASPRPQPLPGPAAAAPKSAQQSQLKRALRLRAYLTLAFLLVAVVPLMFFGAQRVSALFAAQNDSIHDKHERMAQLLAQATYNYLLDQMAALQSTVNHIEAETDADALLAAMNDAAFDPSRLNQLLAAAHTAQPGLLQLYVGNLKGRAVAATTVTTIGVDFHDWTYVKEVLTPGRNQLTFSEVTRPRGSTNVTAIVVAVPLIDSHRELQGFLAGTVDLAPVQRLTDFSRVGQNGQVVIVDRRGRVLAHPREDWRADLHDLSAEGVFQQSLGRDTGVSWYTDLDGNVPRVAGFATVAQVGWKVWVSQPVSELRAELSPLIVSEVRWLAVAAALALLIGYLLAFWLSRPVAQLTLAASRLARGDFSQRANVQPRFAAREHVALAQAFNQMAVDLSSAYQNLEEKVRQRTAELQEANQELGRASRLKSEFLANVSHELRTPLSAIIGFSQILLDGIDGALTYEQRIDVEQVHRSGQSLLTLINQILDLSKIEAGKMDLNLERVELPGVMGSILETMRPLASEKGLRLEAEVPPTLPPLEADPVRLKQILLNLLSNAIKFSNEGRIDVRARPSGRMVRISVTDTGIGITPEAQKLIFEEFVQGDGSTTRRHGGTGLGLSIVRKLVELHGGTIGVVSAPGMGSTFTFTLRTWAAAPAEHLQVAAPSALHLPSQGVAGQAILVVDDDESVRVLISRHLEQEGFSTLQATNAADALSLAREKRPLLMTLDIMMPDASGWWVLEKLKEDPATAGIPVLVVSIVEDQKLIFSLGASDYLAKPYDRSELIRKVHRLLPDLHGRRLLVVDDDPNMRTMLHKVLHDEGAEVVEAVDGEQALAAIAERPPDLVLLDLMMPGMSGFEVVARMRAGVQAAEIPVIIVSAKELTPADVLTLNGHVQRLVSKGQLQPSGLISAIRQVLGQQREDREAA